MTRAVASALVTLALLMSACSAPPFVRCDHTVSFVEKAFFDGTWSHLIHTETLEGPPAPIPPDAELGDVRFLFGEDFVYAVDALDVALLFRVSSHFRVGPEGRCGPTIVDDDHPWTERGFARVNWSEDLAATALRDLAPGWTIEPTLFGLASIDDGTVDLRSEDLPAFERDASGVPSSIRVSTDYLMRPEGCSDTTCESLVRVRHELTHR